MEPANIWLPNIDEKIKQKQLKQVTSVFIKEPSTNRFHPQGLYSEEIFGPIASPVRLITFGYIDLKTTVLHPKVYENFVKINKLYGEIMSGQTEVVFDTEINDFFRLSSLKELKETHIVGTGYSFFLQHFRKLKFTLNNSLGRTDKIKLLEDYNHELTMTKWWVMPAGLRDLRIEEDRPMVEEINKIYTSLIISTNTLPNVVSNDPIWDSIRYGIQLKIAAIHEYIFDIIDDKGGFIQKKVAARSVAMGTRNVLTGTTLCSYSSKKDRHRSTQTRFPLFQAAKAFLPIVLYYIDTIFLNQIFNESSQIFAIDPKTKDLVKMELTETEKKKFLSTEGLEEKIEAFRTPEIRHQPFYVYSKEGKRYYLMMVYDEGDAIHFFRNKKEFSIYFKQLTGKEPDPNRMRPLTNIELLYIATDYAANKRHVHTTRFPVLGARNTYMSEAKIMTTEPARTVMVKNTMTGDTTEFAPFYDYPVLGAPCIDGVRIHPIWLKNIGGDYDGDTCTNHGIWSNEGNKEIMDYLYSKKFFLSPSGALKLTIAALNPVIDITLKNLCYRTYQD